MTEWRFIDSGPCSAFLNMAIDETIAQQVREGKAPPTLRVYEWAIPSVSIGCFQRVASVDLGYCEKKGIPVVRRITGGRGILHSHELTYGFAAPTTHGPFSKGLLDSYRKISDALCRSISMLGLSPEQKAVSDRSGGTDRARNPLCFSSASFAEITLRGRKVVGSAQKRWGDGLLQQGSIPYSIDEEAIKRVFTIDRPVSLREKMIGLREVVPALDPAFLKEAIRVSCEEAFRVKFIRTALSGEEYRIALELESRRYRSPEWNFQR